MNNDQEHIPEVFLSAIEKEVLQAIKVKKIPIGNIALLAKHCKLTELQVSVAIRLLLSKEKI